MSVAVGCGVLGLIGAGMSSFGTLTDAGGRRAGGWEPAAAA